MNDVEVEAFYIETTSCTLLSVCILFVWSPIYPEERHNHQQRELDIAPLGRIKKTIHNRYRKKVPRRADRCETKRQSSSSGLCLACIYKHTHTHLAWGRLLRSCQDKTNPEMRIYTVFRDMKDSSPWALRCICLLLWKPLTCQCPLYLRELSETFQHPKPRTPYTLNPYTLNPGALKPKP